MLNLARKLGRPARVWPGTPFFDKLCTDPAWAAEPKKNGWRSLNVIGERVRIITRHGRELFDAKYEELREALGNLPEDSWFDGELMIQEGRIWLFDVLRLRGTMVTGWPYKERRAALQFVVNGNPLVGCMPSTGTTKAEMFKAALEAGDEGVVFKHQYHIYPMGETRSWIKARLSNLENGDAG